MDRRRFLLGTSLALSGSAVASGVGAFTASTMARSASVSVVDDTDGLIGLVPNPDLSTVGLSNGELQFDPDINVDSIYQFGAFVEGGTDPTPGTFDLVTAPAPSDRSDDAGLRSAFAIVNNTAKIKELDCEVGFSGGDDADTRVFFQFHDDGSQTGSLLTANGGGRTLEYTLSPGDHVGVSFLANALGVSEPENVSVTLSISANAI